VFQTNAKPKYTQEPSSENISYSLGFFLNALFVLMSTNYALHSLHYIGISDHTNLLMYFPVVQVLFAAGYYVWKLHASGEEDEIRDTKLD